MSRASPVMVARSLVIPSKNGFFRPRLADLGNL